MSQPEMTSRERILAAIDFAPVDWIPLACWCFGLTPPADLTWMSDGKPVPYWYTGRLEHIHTLPHAWTVEDDFRRVAAWQSLGLDDVIDISVPWGVDPRVRWRDFQQEDEQGTILVREYDTPSGSLRHAVRHAAEQIDPGWPIQPRHVPLMEDFNIPRGVRHACTGAEDIPKLRYLLTDPSSDLLASYKNRLDRVREFADREGIAVQAWSAFGMDAVVWLTGTESAILMSMTEPDVFEEILDLVHESDLLRTGLALDHGGVDVMAMRGWYSSTDFWSPKLFQKFLVPRIKQLADLAHDAGKKFAYVMTTGVEVMADLLIETGMDLLYYVDPVQDKVDFELIKRKLHGHIALAGGVNSALTLGTGTRNELESQVAHACQVLGRESGFILAPVDALFPNTPWESVLQLIENWKRHRLR
ncbi:MAG: hypothetical protein JW829_09870 [Pirellulales bacterium]|nr:hypothetical protein [Pirellulales bacterium]